MTKKVARFLAIDLGDRRTGLALGDSLTNIVSPIGTIEATKGPALLAELKKTIDETGAGRDRDRPAAQHGWKRGRCATLWLLPRCWRISYAFARRTKHELVGRMVQPFTGRELTRPHSGHLVVSLSWYPQVGH